MRPDHPSVATAHEGVVLGSRGEHGLATLYLAGDLDIATAPRLAEAIEELLSQGSDRIAVDGSRVDFIDLRGVTPLLEARRRLLLIDDTTRVWWQRPSAAVRHLLAVTGLGDLLPEGAPR